MVGFGRIAVRKTWSSCLGYRHLRAFSLCRAGLAFARACLRASQQGTAPPATGDDLLAVWRIIDAAYESHRTGRRVELSAKTAR